MCGILASFKMDKRITGTLLNNLSIRGRDGYGIWTITKTKKSIKNIGDYCPKFAKKQLLIANSRAIPTTEVETGAGKGIENQQPFENDRYVVVHNGIISNDKELIKEYDLKPTSIVDTAILPELFNKVGVIEGLKLLKGSFAIICHDKINENVFIAKNFMPLQFLKYRHGFVCISLKEMIPEFFKNKAVEIEPYTCYEIDIKKVDRNNPLNIIKHSLYLKERNKKVLVICSGGIDSTTTAYLYKHLGYDVNLIHFTYGQAAQEAELFSVKKIAEDLKAPLTIYDAQPIFNSFSSVSRLLNNSGSNKETQLLDAESTFSYVPNRNAIFAMIAGAVAEMNNCDTVTFGGQQMDSVYPDNNNTFVNAVDNLLKYSLNWNTNVKFTSPLINIIKHEIVELGMKLGVPYEFVCSCYYPKILSNKIVPCGECGCCQFRIYAFKMIRAIDVQFPKSKLCKIDYSKVYDVDEFIVKYIQEYT